MDGSLATTGVDLPGKGHVFAKTGTTIAPGDDGETIELKAQNLAGYIETKSGRLVAYALMVNDAGAVRDIETDVVRSDHRRSADLQHHLRDPLIRRLSDGHRRGLALPWAFRRASRRTCQVCVAGV